MLLRSFALWALAVALVFLGYRAWGWGGVALVAGVMVFWALLHFTRLLHVLRRAANRPKGYVDSAVMLSVKLKAGMGLLQVVGLTRSLGEELSQTPEVWRWTDNSGASVTCEMTKGKLARFELKRPAATEA